MLLCKGDQVILVTTKHPIGNQEAMHCIQGQQHLQKAAELLFTRVDLQLECIC